MSKKKEKNPVQEAAAPKEVLEEQAGEAEAVELEAGPQANAPGEEPEAVPEEAPAQEEPKEPVRQYVVCPHCGEKIWL